jgi:hypothetical protein
MSVTWTGIPEFRRKMAALRTGTPRQIGAALYQEGQHIMTRSKSEFVPVDTGTLRASGQVTLPRQESGRVVVELGYGGAASAYALVQHERMDFHHPVGQAKYLEQPVNEAAAGFGQRIASRIGRMM